MPKVNYKEYVQKIRETSGAPSLKEEIVRGGITLLGTAILLVVAMMVGLIPELEATSNLKITAYGSWVP